MVNLMDFPDELLLQIVDETLPDGIEALARCSSRSAILSSDALKKHEADKEKYQNIEIKEGECPGPLLIEVVQNPRCGQYPRYVNFEYCREDVRVPLDQDIAEDLTQALVQQPCVPLKELLHWTQEATSGNQDVIIAILLLLLPNVESLLIPSYRYCESLIRNVVKWSRESIIPQPNLPLARLENVTIWDDQWNSGIPAEFFVSHGLKTFGGLPSLRTLMCFYKTTRALCNADITLQFYNACTAMQICNLELSSDGLDLILQHIKNLTRFTYVDRYYSGISRHLDATLQKYASQSLKEIRLQCWHNPISELPSHGFHSLTGFTVLQKITITLDTIRHGGYGNLSRPSLVDFLPHSVEELTIIGPTKRRIAEKILDDSSCAKAVHFPGLKKIHIVKTEYFCLSPIMVAFEKAGIIMDLDHVEQELGEAPGQDSQ